MTQSLFRIFISEKYTVQWLELYLFSYTFHNHCPKEYSKNVHLFPGDNRDSFKVQFSSVQHYFTLYYACQSYIYNCVLYWILYIDWTESVYNNIPLWYAINGLHETDVKLIVHEKFGVEFENFMFGVKH